MNLLSILFIFIFVCLICIPILLHIPILHLSEKDKELIKQNGLVHFTSEESALKIEKEGFKGNNSHMGGIERLLGKMVWFYIYNENLEQNQNILLNTKRGKQDVHKYEKLIIVKKVDDAQLNRMRKRIGFCKVDRAIVYKGELFVPNQIFVK